ETWQRTSERLDGQERALAEQVAVARVRHQAAAERVASLRAALADEEGQARPQAERWQRLEREAREAGVLAGAMAAVHLDRTRGAGSVNLYPEARSKSELLIERLQRAGGGAERARAVRDLLIGVGQESGLAYLRAWLGAREWLRQRVPPQIAEVDDPLETLGRVRDHLERLRERLARQENNLRGQSGDVARNIETQVRKARREVTRLNHDLGAVRFGSIRGVRIRVQPVERRERVLRALREGEAQQLLFQAEMPIEEAMDELFRRYGGRTGGQRLLDYREYLELQVEVMRQAGREWERANPTRMSTGEAIGVGAAIMMVVLTAWERHANLLRARRSAGTLRFLFLDEANRLSQDNLGVLFELCESLELQLLIAAPEVARAEGNTTYRLIRQVAGDGREVVLVTGRRTARSDSSE
ncbi:MAG: SbcC/MukB-like Walker B domain-containing protein, partial [Myxococcota bacterium]